MTTSVTVKSTKPPIKLVSERSGITLVIDRSITTTSGGGSGTVTNVSGTAPISVTSPTTTPAISISAATTSLPGTLSAADKTKLDSVTSGAAVSAVSGTAPIVITGTTAAPTVTVATGTTAGTVAAGDDARFSNWNWRLDWDPENTYAIGDAVYYFGSAWYAIRINTGITPVLGLDWQPVASSATGVLPITVASGAVSIAAATTSAAGSMSAADKVKLDATGTNSDLAQNTSHTYISSAGLVGYGLNNGSYASTPDSAALDIVGDLEITARMQPTSWTAGSNQGIVGKRQVAGQLSYVFSMLSGKPSLNWTTDGTTVKTAASLTAVPFTTEAGWVRITFDVDNGASGNTATFYTAPDSATEPTSWTLLGTVTTAGTTSIFSGTSVVEFGSNLIGNNQVIGVLKRAIIRNSVGDIVCDADFEAATEDCLAFTETANGASVSVTTARYFYGMPNAQWSTTGTASTSANQTLYSPFEVIAPISVDMFIAETTVAASAGTMRVGIFTADANLQPTGTCLAQGTIPYTTTLGVYTKQITPLTLQPGRYLVAFNVTTSSTWRRLAGGISFSPQILGANTFSSRVYYAETMSGDYTTANPWTVKVDGVTPHVHTALLRWKAA